eukprot:13702303-Alexandrium_andersonii.AAC.1
MAALAVDPTRLMSGPRRHAQGPASSSQPSRAPPAGVAVGQTDHPPAVAQKPLREPRSGRTASLP